MASAHGLSLHSFRTESGDSEHYIAIEAPPQLSLGRQIDAVAQRYAEALQSLRLSPDSAVFRRIYLSDAANQAALVRDSSLYREPLDSPVAVSVVQQPPLSGAKLAMLAYHIEAAAPLAKSRTGAGDLLLQKGALRHLWTTQLCTANTAAPSSAAEQTRDVFERLIGALDGQGGTLADNCVRTWIYVKDVDVFYQDMVAARSALFAQHGLTRDTHYLASTGIEGTCSHRYDVVLMDAYSIIGLAPEQVSYLNAYDRLCHTRDYNVTFERGTRIAYADRAHLLISGTASIDPAGHVMHCGDVGRQLARAMGNVDALLRAGGGSIEAMSHFIIYLRDPSDHDVVEACFAESFPGVPRLILRGPVCRPEWLVEVEGVAMVPNDAPALPAF
ncbi:MAG TPA: Rid family hydrolase [Acetobacteraceae bacterium]|nr:Rid family hydrolase [Acetobacteraceae bacterium]